MISRDIVISRLAALMPELRRDHHVVSLGLFGSVARGDAVADSDVDVLVEFEQDARVGLFTLVRVQARLEEALGLAVDLVDEHPRLGSRFRSAIQQDLIRVA